MDDRWYVRSAPLRNGASRLFCFPYAGVGAAIYRGWEPELAPDVDVIAVEPPGRGARFREPALPSLGEVVAAALAALRPLIRPPYALFGHSMGSVVGFELARAVRRVGLAPPSHLFVSGRRAPQLPPPRFDPPIHQLSDERFVAEVQQRYDGIPAQVLAEPELLELLLPTLRADIEALETYAYRDEAALECPITAFGGRDDETVSTAELEAWREQTSAPFQLLSMPGDHFYVRSPSEHLLGAVRERLTASPARTARP